MSTSATNRKRPLIDDEHVEVSTTKRPRTATSQTSIGRGQDMSVNDSSKAPSSWTFTPRMIARKRKSQNAPGGGHRKRQRTEDAQPKTVSPNLFLERLPREVRDMIYAELLGQGRNVYCLDRYRAEELRTAQIEAPARVEREIALSQMLIEEFEKSPSSPPTPWVDAEIREAKSDIDMYLSGQLGQPTIKFIDTTILKTCRQLRDEALHYLLSKNPIHLVPELELDSFKPQRCDMVHSLAAHYEQVIKFNDTVNHVLLKARDISVRVTRDVVPALARILEQRHSIGTPDLRDLHIWHTWHDFKSHENFKNHLRLLETIQAQNFSFHLCRLEKSQGYEIHTYKNSTQHPLPEDIKLSSATKDSIKQLKSCIEKTGPRPQSEPFCTRDPW